MVGGEADEEVTLRLGVTLTPEVLENFEPALDRIREDHPNWTIELEQTPQDAIVERTNSQIASGELPDVVEVQGLFAQPWIRQEAFLDLSDRFDDDFSDEDFWSSAVGQFRWEEGIYGVPNIVQPDLVYLNLEMFEEAGIEPPDDDWTFDDLMDLAIDLTLDSEGRTPRDADFDRNDVTQWGLSVTPNNIWTRHYMLPFGADPCANEDCTEVAFSDPDVQEALEWWAELSAEYGAAPSDPYTGNQTGVPGEGFQAGIAAMGINGFFLVGVLNETREIDYDIVEFPTGPAGVKASPLSTNGWTIAADTEHPDEAWELIQELSSNEFLSEAWAEEGHGVPARRASSDAVLTEGGEPANQDAILRTLEYADVFYPNTDGAFEAYSRTTDIFIQMMAGEISVEEGTEQIDEIVNDTLSSSGE
ncbi:MAG: ABC transporter substrate-binding protein [Chloroflexota bacterium]